MSQPPSLPKDNKLSCFSYPNPGGGGRVQKMLSLLFKACPRSSRVNLAPSLLFRSGLSLLCFILLGLTFILFSFKKGENGKIIIIDTFLYTGVAFSATNVLSSVKTLLLMHVVFPLDTICFLFFLLWRPEPHKFERGSEIEYRQSSASPQDRFSSSLLFCDRILRLWYQRFVLQKNI